MPLLHTKKSPLLVAVVGATGKQGGAATRALLQYGHRVRALTRSVDSPAAKRLKTSGAEIAYADLEDAASLIAALHSVNAVFGMTTPFETNVIAEAKQGKRLVDAAVANHVGHFVFTSVADADRHTGVPHFESKYKVEQYLKHSGLSWTVIAPAAFLDNFRTGWYKTSLDKGVLAMPMPPNLSLQYICATDIGRCGALAIHQRASFLNKRLDIAGDAITGTHLAELFGYAYGHSITYQEIPLATVQDYSADLASMFRYFQTYGMHADIGALRAAYPEVTWHTCAQWIMEEFQV